MRCNEVFDSSRGRRMGPSGEFLFSKQRLERWENTQEMVVVVQEVDGNDAFVGLKQSTVR